jgi:TP901 family phage tail tape measure protein
MAKQISDEKIKLSIIIDGNPAQKELFELEKATRKLTEENKELGLEKKKLIAAGKQETEEYKNVTAAIKANSTAINANKVKMAELQKELGLTGLTMKQLGDKAVHLKMVLRNLIPGSADYKRYEADLKAVTNRIDEVRGKSKEAGFSIGAMADNFNRYAALGASIFAMATGVVLSLQKMIDYNGKLSGAQSNVMKTTRMSKEEVDELTKSFGLFESRTSRINLLKIAEVGGQLNIAKDEIFNFVRVMDKASVALGDSFEGGAEQVADKLGKIKGLYEELKNAGVEPVFESVGSALNDLGADGAATEQNIAEFATRVGALPDAIKPTIQQALGLGAAFEESGLKAEIAGTNYGKVISIAAKDMGAFATILKRPQAELEKLINTNPTEFFLQFASSLKGLDATDLSKVLDYLKLNDNEVKMVLGAASGNVDMFREKIKLAGVSMAEATSLTDEYNIKNKDLEATLEKIRKTVNGWFSSEGLVAFLAAAAQGFGKLIGATDDADGSGQRWRNTLAFIAKAIAVITAALLTNVAWLKLTALWTSRNTEATLLYNLGMKARAVAEGVSVVATQAWAAAQMLLRGNIVGATQAIRVMAATMMTTPWGLVLGLIAAVTTAYIAFGESADKAARQQKIFSGIAKETESDVRKEVDALNIKLKVAKDINESDEVRKRALKDIIALSGEHLKGLTLENINTAEGKKLLDEYTTSLEKVARSKAVAAKLTELYIEMLDLEKSEIMDNVKWYEYMWNAIKTGGDTSRMALANFKSGLTNKGEAKKELQEVIDQLLKEQEGEYKANIKVKSTSDKKSDIYVPTSDEDKAADKAREKAERQQETRKKDLERQLAEIRDLKHKAMEEELNLMKDGFEKEIALQKEAHRKKTEDLKAQLITQADFKKADQNINSPKSTKQDVAFWTAQKVAWLEKNKHINNLIEIAERTHHAKMSTIIAGEYDRQIKKLEEKYNREKTVRETNYLAYLNTIHTFNDAKKALEGVVDKHQLDDVKTLEQAKAALKEDFDKQELKRELKFLEESIAKMNAQVKSIPFMGIDLNLLTAEQREKIKADIEVVELAAKKIEKALGGAGGTNDGEETPEEREAREQKWTGKFEDFNGGADILGFTPDQWEETFLNLDTLNAKMLAGAMVVTALQNMWGQYDAFMTAAENNRIKQYEKGSETRKRKLKWELDNGIINQVQYKRGVEQLEMDVERKKAELEYKQAKRKKAMSIVETIMNTSIAIMQAFSQLGPIGGAIAAVLIGTMGALQIKTISDQPLPARGFEKGLYPEYVKREQDGKIFKSRYGGKTKSGLVTSPTHFLTGENGPEMIIDSQAYKNLSPGVRDALVRELRGIKGFEKGFYNNSLNGSRFEIPPGPVPPAAHQVVDLNYALTVISRNSDILEKIHSDGIIAVMSRDPREIKKLIDDMNRIEKSREKARN